MALPFADPVVISLLVGTGLVGDRVAIGNAVISTPSIRVASTGDLEAPTSWERTPIYQLEVWADDAVTAGTLATSISNLWPSIRRVTAAGAYVSGAWVERQPYAVPDPESGLSRYLLEVGLRLHSPS